MKARTTDRPVFLYIEVPDDAKIGDSFPINGHATITSITASVTETFRNGQPVVKLGEPEARIRLSVEPA